jgi:membrane fusion protein (multidrug efflux system)
VKTSSAICRAARRLCLAPAVPAAFALASLLPAVTVNAQEAPGVVVATATRVAFPLTVEALGTARANESVEIRPKVTETVTTIHFAEGQHVEAGQILVELEDAEARADVAAARAQLVDSESQYARAEELYRSRLVSASELESLEARRDANRAALDAAQSRLSDTVVRAPFAGRVGLRRVSIGSLVGPSVVITTLDDTDTIKLDFDVPETALSRVQAGLPVTAHSAAWPDSTFAGTIASVDTRVDPVSRTVTVRALVPNRDQLLRPGMFLTVDVVREEVTALVIPEQAIVPEQSRQFVFVVGDDNVVEQREVQVGRRRPGQVEITNGLSEGEVVVAEGTQKARPGGAVRVVERMEVAP